MLVPALLQVVLDFTPPSCCVWDQFGLRMCSAGDLDHDGTTDLLISDPLDGDACVQAGRTWAICGRSFRVLASWRGSDGEELGSTIASVGDVDGDRAPDYFLGGSNDRTTGLAKARVVSGAQGHTLIEMTVIAFEGSRGGPTPAALGDADGDRVRDFAIGSRRAWGSHGYAVGGRVTAHSGRDGRELWRVEDLHDELSLGRTMVAVGDVDGDGVEDLAAAANPNALHREHSGYLALLSGRDGRLLWRVDSWGTSSFTTLASGIDVDGDGVLDVLATESLGWPGRVAAYSAVTGELLRESPVDYAGDIAVQSDVCGDGFPDIAVGDPGGPEATTGLHVLCGANFRGLLTIGKRPWSGPSGLGQSIVALDDLDGDGEGELAVGYTTCCDHSWPGAVHVIGSRDRSVIRSISRDDLLGFARER